MTRNEAKKLILLEVPAGLKMKYRHYYSASDGRPLLHVTSGVGAGWWVANGKAMTSDGETYDGPRVLDQTEAWLENQEGVVVAEGCASVNPKDTPNKKLGRAIAHNRCVKAWHKAQAQGN